MSQNKALYTESGMKVDLSEFSHFRFETCAAHRALNGIKEIDFGWWDDDEKCIILLELKGLHKVRKDKRPEKAAMFLDNLWKKSLDVVTMLSAVWLKTKGSNGIKKCLPEEVHKKREIKIYHLINCEPAFEPHLMTLHTKLRQKFSGYLSLFDNIIKFQVISSRQAEQKIFRDKETKRPFVWQARRS